IRMVTATGRVTENLAKFTKSPFLLSAHADLRAVLDGVGAHRYNLLSRLETADHLNPGGVGCANGHRALMGKEFGAAHFQRDDEGTLLAGLHSLSWDSNSSGHAGSLDPGADEHPRLEQLFAIFDRGAHYELSAVGVGGGVDLHDLGAELSVRDGVDRELHGHS